MPEPGPGAGPGAEPGAGAGTGRRDHRGPGTAGRRLVLAGAALARWRPSWRWALGVVRSFVVSFAALALTFQLLPGPQVPANGYETVATLVITVLLVGALVRPLLVEITVWTGVLGLLLSGLLAQSLILGIALSFVPGIEPLDLLEVALTAWGVAVVAAVINWIVDTSSEEVFLAQLLGRAVRTARATEVSGPGLLVVQLDGVAEPLVRQAAAAGAMPYLTRLLRDGSHRLRGWHTGLPSTTPAGQAVLLHGDVTAIPGFRWFDKERGRVLEVSKPADAAQAERDFSTGRGLLADGGASVANVFSGDAPVQALTVSHPRLPGSERGAAAFASARSGLARSFILFLGQVLAEWYQGRRQRKRDVVPRVNRFGAFVFLRGLTTVVLRDLTVSIVADQLARGVPVVYVDLLDYDEVAHHAGPTRPESMRTLESLDRVLRFLADVVAEVGRDYELVVVSDHGQTQGSTFLQLEGRSLADAVREIVDGHVAAATRPAEVMGPANLLSAQGDRRHRVLERVVDRTERSGTDRGAAASAGPTSAGPDVHVVAGGSIAHLYLPDHPGRLSRERLDEVLPGLVPGLVALRHVGLVMTRRDDGTVLVESADGWRELTGQGAAGGEVTGGEVTGGEGADPLAPYGAGAARDLWQLESRWHVGDVVVLGRYDPRLGEVAAFEELVGSHGGLGGWQTEALLVHPAGWPVPDGAERLTGLDVHRLLVDRLAELGLRREAEPTPVEDPRPAPVTR